MCGITGFLNLDNNSVSKNTINLMTKTLRHRGPDGMDIFVNKNVALGHTRLSIVDTTKNGDQPMVSRCGNFVITYNGEIYNFLKLKRILEKDGFIFNSNSDTEVILNGFIKWKHKVLDKLNGMFAFAIWNKKEQKLFIARDRYGIKPLYIAKFKKVFLFGSEVKSFLKHPNFQTRIEHQSVLEYFTFQNFFTNKTLFKNVNTFKAGHFLYISSKDELESEYWDYLFESSKKSVSLYRSKLLDKLKKAVKRQHMADREVSIGCYLSGGIDSGSITSLSSSYIENLKTFTVGYDTNSISGIEIIEDERAKAEYMSYLFKTEHYEMVLKSGDMENCLKKLMWHLEVPKVGQSYPNYYASKLASKFCKVVLTGTGGDELFAGYPWRYYRAVINENFESYCKKYFKFWKRMIPDESYKKFFNPLKDIEFNTFDIFRDVLKKFKDKKLSHYDYINSSLYLEAKTFLVGLLEVEDKLSMSHGLESRVPFLDNELVELAAQIPDTFKQKGREGKWILKKAMEDFLPKNVLLLSILIYTNH